MLCFTLERCVRILALLSCFRLSSGFVSGFGHSRSRFGLAVGACGLEFAQAVRSSVRVHLLSSFCFLSFVWHAACVFHWLRAFMFVMFCVNTQLMSLLISCVASDSVLLPCACVFVLCEHMAFVIVSVCYVLMSIVLTPPILFPDYWFICPTCVVSLPSSFAPFIISLCLQSRASSSSNVVCACLVRLFNFFIQLSPFPPVIESSLSSLLPHPDTK